MLVETHHAGVRRQQRCIPPEALDLLWDFGRVARSHGADRLFFDRRSRRRVAAALGPDGLRRAERLLNTYAVVADDGAVITCAWRSRRLHRS